MTTIHANSPRDAMIRLENMVGLAGVTVPLKSLRQQIAAAITAVIQVARLGDGSRKIVSLQEITGMEGDVIEMQEIFCFRQTGVRSDGKYLGQFTATVIRPRFMERLSVRGVTLPERVFTPASTPEKVGV